MNTEDKNKQQHIEDNAINHKANIADGREINQQQQQRNEIHQPRDNA